jgi:hypothetical protein
MKGLEVWGNEYVEKLAVANPTRETVKAAYIDGIVFAREQISAMVNTIGNTNGNTKYIMLAILIKALGEGEGDKSVKK